MSQQSTIKDRLQLIPAQLEHIQQHHIILLSILLTALTLRFWGLPFGLPNLTRPDEQNISQFVSMHIIQSCFAGKPDFNPHFFEYPSLYIYIVTFLYGLYYWLGHLLSWFPTPNDFVFHYVDNFTPFHLMSRVVTALMGTATIWAQYRLGKSIWPNNRILGLVSAGIFAVTYLHVRDSHFGVTDVPVTLWATLALWMAVDFYQRGKHQNLLLAAVFSGLAAGTKYPVGLVMLSPLLALWLRYQIKNPRPEIPLWSQTQFVSRVLQLVGTTFGVFLLTSPFILLDWPQFLADFNRQREHMIQGHFLDLGIGWIYHLTFTLRHGLGLPLLTAGLTGGVLAVTKRYRPLWPVLMFGLAFYLWVGSTKTVFVRYAIPLVPVLVTFAVLAIKECSQWISVRLPKIPHIAIVLTLVSVIAIPTLMNSLRYDWLLSQDDTRTLARNWFIEHLKPKEAVGIGLALAHIDLPYHYNKYFLAPKEIQHTFGNLERHFVPSTEIKISDQPTQRHEFNINTYNNTAALNKLRMRYFATGHSPLTLFNVPAFEQDAIDKQYKSIVTFRATSSKQTGPTRHDYDQLDAFFVPYRNLWSIERPGPDIRIYQAI